MANKRKTTTAIVAGVTAVALLLGGTFAWTSIQQEAKNEAIVDINPGGRLHDDFNGANKDVYVENFGDNQTGVPIFARIRLDQYMEIGQEAGKNKEADNRNVKPLIGTDIDDVSTWETYIPGDLSDTTKVQANDNWTWTMGNDDTNKPYYMPTFNKNKDSLAADINGTYEGTKEGDIVHYDDYIFYDADSEAVIKDATYDWDEDTDEDSVTSTRDENAPIDSADVLLKEEEHKAVPITKTAEVITMAQWLERLNDGDPDNDTGDFWVYDTDGWAYWANAIQPGETTGLLLDGITLSKTPDDNYYYGINVVGQFATAGDLSAFNSGTETMTKEASDLLGMITNTEAELVISGAADLFSGTGTTYSASMKKLGVATGEDTGTITWSAAVDGAEIALADLNGISIDANSGRLTVPAGVAHKTKITVTATSESGATASKTVTVIDGYEALKTASYGDKVVIDSQQWWVVAKEEDKAMIWAVNPSSERKVFDAENSGIWRDSDLRAFLNSDEYLDTVPTLKAHPVEYTISTAGDRYREEAFIETQDKVFILSEADMFGTADGKATTDVREYTTGVAQKLVTPEMLHVQYYKYYWARSMRYSSPRICTVINTPDYLSEEPNSSAPNDDEYYRPAMWVDLTK